MDLRLRRVASESARGTALCVGDHSLPQRAPCNPTAVCCRDRLRTRRHHPAPAVPLPPRPRSGSTRPAGCADPRSRTATPLHLGRFDALSGQLGGSFDTIIIVNWIHQIEPDRLRNWIAACVGTNLKPGGCLLLDTVRDPAYDYNHNVHYLTPAGLAVHHLGSYVRQRDVWVLIREDQS